MYFLSLHIRWLFCAAGADCKVSRQEEERGRALNWERQMH